MISKSIVGKNSTTYVDSDRTSSRDKITAKSTVTYRRFRSVDSPNQSSGQRDSEAIGRVSTHESDDDTKQSKTTHSHLKDCVKSNRKQTKPKKSLFLANTHGITATAVAADRNDRNRNTTAHHLEMYSFNPNLWFIPQLRLGPALACPTSFTNETRHASDSSLTNSNISQYTLTDQGIQCGPPRFVNVVHKSWLLATVQERCNWYHMTKQTILKRRNTFFHRNCTDIAFSMCSRSNHNLQGRLPLHSTTHCRNVLNRLQTSQSILNRDTHSIRVMLAILHSNLCLPAVRIFGWLLSKIWRILFQGIHVDVEGVQRLHALLAQAKKEGTQFGMAYIPTHKTHLDYLIISYLCFAHGLPIPRIAAGDNMKLPIIGTFLRANGSFFMRRSWGNDLLYKCVLSAYVHELMDDDNPLEVFLEGGRSRVGRVSSLKKGFLSLLNDYIRFERDQDKPKTLWLVPISLDYDRVLEVKEYANQRLGKKKQKESLYELLRSVKNLFATSCGHAYVRFGEGISLQPQDRVYNVTNIIGYRLQELCTVTSTCIVASILLWKRSSMNFDILEAYFNWLLMELDLRNVSIEHLSGKSKEICKQAVSMLDVPIHGSKIVFSPSDMPPSRILEVDYYRNQLLHRFLPELAVFGAIQSFCTHIWNGIWSTNTTAIHETKLLPMIGFLWRFLRKLVHHSDPEICIPEVHTLLSRVTCVRIVGIHSAKVYLVDWSAWKRCRLVHFNLSLLWPLLDVMWVTVHTACGLREGEAMIYEEFIIKVQQLAENLLVTKQIAHTEALCKETIKQAVEWLIQLEILYYKHDRDHCPSLGAATAPSKTVTSRVRTIEASGNEVYLRCVVDMFRHRPTALLGHFLSQVGTRRIIAP
uniref:Glycerol3phosphate acyltransferase putative n=1 Tax=Albugo laibachii Nc14 TaxID=890382 RepID=F0W771_9STRA|nr:glycerol3phosphate acyltransferase putative [Albugo laibachii Nc14]|eukprot:CCA16970.1 glycerol3phosphate acyltransferase putative [Albugo laibachii Nc14]